jgi:sorting nexin-29
VPTERKTDITVPTYKNKGDKLHCQNYRGISLLCTGYTVLTTVLTNILKKYINHKTGECQVGFTGGKSIMDQIFMCKNLLERAWAYNVEIYLILIDFQSAYDSI